MKKITVEEIKKLRGKTGISIMKCRKALEESGGDLVKAQKILEKKGATAAAKKKERETAEGIIEAYVHQNGKVGVMLKVMCETDFVARNKDFKNFAHEAAMQICAMDPENVKSLMKQDYIREPGKTIEGLKNDLVVKLGENIKVGSFIRYAL